ncbi:MAG: hypothetical protein ACYDAQ_21775 [Mycobacteriales bacterium]
MTRDLATRPETSPERSKQELTEAADWVAISIIATIMFAVPFALRYGFSEDANEHGVRNVLGWILCSASLLGGLLGTVLSFVVLRARAARDPRAQQRAEGAWSALLGALGVGGVCFVAWWALLAA